MTDDKKNIPMDNTMPEGDAPVMYVPTPRNTYAMDQLIKEVLDLFPETSYEVSARNQRGVAFDVQFTPDTEHARDLMVLLSLLADEAYNRDVRLLSIVADIEGVLVSFRNNPQIQDDPAPFGLAEAHAVLSGETP